MRPKLSQRHAFLNRDAVVDNMEIGNLKIDHPLAPRVLDIRVPDVPFPGHCPIEHLSAGRDVVDLDRDVTSDNTQRFTNTVARDASANRIKLGDKAIHFTPDIRLIDWAGKIRNVYSRIGH
jgi:hypothetical protein